VTGFLRRVDRSFVRLRRQLAARFRAYSSLPAERSGPDVGIPGPRARNAVTNLSFAPTARGWHDTRRKLISRRSLSRQSVDFPAWYGEVVRRAGLAESSLVRGAMVIKPYGYAIWEAIQRALDDRIKATGHDNLNFPLLVPNTML
jgi:hypothetical protein